MPREGDIPLLPLRSRSGEHRVENDQHGNQEGGKQAGIAQAGEWLAEQGGQWFQIDMKKPQNFDSIVLDNTWAL